MVKKLVKPVSLLVTLALVASGCEQLSQNKQAAGAGAGALIGAGLGALVAGKKHRAKGALIGAALGAAAGWGVGKYLESRDRTAVETNRIHNYSANQGSRIELIGAGANPNATKPGGTINLQTTYAIMAPNVNQSIPVTETRTITFNGVGLNATGTVARVATKTEGVTRTPGTYTTALPITLPANAAVGTYQLTVTVAGAGTTKQQTATFSVS